jgi:hypothetical protein
VFQEDPQFELAVCTVQVKDNISTIETCVKIRPFRGAKFIHFSDYSIMEITNPTYYGVATGMRKNQNVSMLFNMVSKRRCPQINNKMWEKAKDTLNQAESAAYINVQIIREEPRGSWTRTGNLTSKLGLDRGERCDEVGQVMHIRVSHRIRQ